MVTIGNPIFWSVFGVVVVVALALDLFVFHRKAHEVSFREALTWTFVWIGLSLIFNLWIYLDAGARPGLEFLTGYLIEKALSVDNIFVFLVVFNYFAVPPKYQHRVLFWGILGAIVLRGVFILLGTALISRFHWVLLIFGAFLVWTGLRFLLKKETEVHPERNPVVRFFQRVVPITNQYHGKKFFIREGGKRYATPLFLVLVVVEATDVVFAVDSIPAIFAITLDPFIVFTSNIFAILGLRALYFVLADLIDRFVYLKHALGLVLIFVGTKMLIADFFKIPIEISLGVVLLLLAGSMILSWLKVRRGGGPPPPAAEVAAAGEENP